MNNARDKITFDFDIADLPMLADALMLSGNVAMMSGHKKAQARLRQLTAMIREQIPRAATLFDDHVLFEICAALRTNPDWSVNIKPAHSSWSWERKGYIIVTIGERSFRSSDYQHTGDSVEFSELKEFLEEMAPLRQTINPT